MINYLKEYDFWEVLASIAAVLGAVGTFLFFLYRKIKNMRYVPIVKVTELNNNLYTLYKAFISRDDEHFINSVGTFFRIEITNTVKNNYIIKNIFSGYNKYHLKPSEYAILTNLKIVNSRPTYSEKFLFPLKIEGFEYKVFYLFIEIPIPKQLGLTLFKLYGSEIKNSEQFLRFKATTMKGSNIDATISEEIRKKNTKFREFMGVEFIDAHLGGAFLGNPNLLNNGELLHFNDLLGYLPTNTQSDIMEESNSTNEYDALYYLKHKYFYFKFEFVRNRSSIIKIAIKTSLWFFKYTQKTNHLPFKEKDSVNNFIIQTHSAIEKLKEVEKDLEVPSETIKTLKESLKKQLIDYNKKLIPPGKVIELIETNKYVEARQIAIELYDGETKDGTYFYLLGVIGFYLNDFTDAIDNLVQASAFGHQSTELEMILALSYQNVRNYSKAIIHFNTELRVGQRTNNTTLGIYNRIFECFEYLIEPQQLEESLKMLVEFRTHLIIDNSKNAYYVNQIALKLSNLGIYDEAMIMLTIAKNYYESQNIDEFEDLSNIYNNIGLNNDRLGGFEKAREFYLKAESTLILDENYNEEFLIAIYTNLGSTYNHLNEPLKALEYYKKALLIYEDSNKDLDSGFITYTKNNISSLYVNLKDYKNAIKYLNEAILDSTKIYGNESIETSKIKLNAGIALHNIIVMSDKYKKMKQLSINYIQTSFDVRMNIYGKDHPLTIEAKEALGKIKRDFG